MVELAFIGHTDALVLILSKTYQKLYVKQVMQMMLLNHKHDCKRIILILSW